jgi:hypothetical protein
VWHNGYVPTELHAQNLQASSDEPPSSALGSTHHHQMHVMADINHMKQIPVVEKEKLDEVLQQSLWKLFLKCTYVQTNFEANRTSMQYDK